MLHGVVGACERRRRQSQHKAREAKGTEFEGWGRRHTIWRVSEAPGGTPEGGDAKSRILSQLELTEDGQTVAEQINRNPPNTCTRGILKFSSRMATGACALHLPLDERVKAVLSAATTAAASPPVQ